MTPESDATRTATTTTDTTRAAKVRAASYVLTLVRTPAGCPADPPIRLGASTILGRTAAIAIPDGALSREHLRIQVGVRGLSLTDLDTKNGTRVNGKRIHGAVEVPVPAVVRLGGTVAIIEASPSTLAPVVSDPHKMIGQHPAHRQMLAHLRTVATSPMSVLLLGETGTGKELAARLVHRWSGRRGRCVAVNCAAIPETLIESTLFGHKKGAFTGANTDASGVFRDASGGTLFLDEVGELSLVAQAKLLRSLEERTVTPVGASQPVAVDVRVVAATHRNLKADSAAGRFRMDLFARLQSFPVRLPPLRDRRSDIVPLFHHFLAGGAGGLARPTLDVDLVEQLLLYPWPMNVRELRALAERLALLFAGAERLSLADVGDALTAASTPPSGAGGPVGTVSRAKAPSRDQLETLLVSHRGNVGQIAKALERDRTQVYRWLRKYELDADTFRG